MTTVSVTFPPHVPTNTVAAFTSRLGAYGLLQISDDKRQVTVSILRDSRLPSLKMWLAAMARYGNVHWHIEPEISN
jgi:hypothetical protein